MVLLNLVLLARSDLQLPGLQDHLQLEPGLIGLEETRDSMGVRQQLPLPLLIAVLQGSDLPTPRSILLRGPGLLSKIQKIS